MEFSEDAIRQLTKHIWSTTVGFEVKSSPSKELAPNGKQRVLVGCVQISGSWQGSVTMHCSEELARRAAATLFETKPDAISAELVQDTLGELTNITSGNIKAMIPELCQISLPVVAEETDYKVRIPGSRLIIQFHFECQGQPLLVSLLERDGDEL